MERRKRDLLVNITRKPILSLQINAFPERKLFSYPTENNGRDTRAAVLNAALSQKHGCENDESRQLMSREKRTDDKERKRGQKVMLSSIRASFTIRKQAKWATEIGQSKREQLKEKQEMNGVTAHSDLGKK